MNIHVPNKLSSPNANMQTPNFCTSCTLRTSQNSVLTREIRLPYAGNSLLLQAQFLCLLVGPKYNHHSQKLRANLLLSHRISESSFGPIIILILTLVHCCQRMEAEVYQMEIPSGLKKHCNMHSLQLGPCSI